LAKAVEAARPDVGGGPDRAAHRSVRSAAIAETLMTSYRELRDRLKAAQSLPEQRTHWLYRWPGGAPAFYMVNRTIYDLHGRPTFYVVDGATDTDKTVFDYDGNAVFAVVNNWLTERATGRDAFYFDMNDNPFEPVKEEVLRRSEGDDEPA
jgi:hypothetical protein